jgi:hypothetical protein
VLFFLPSARVSGTCAEVRVACGVEHGVGNGRERPRLGGCLAVPKLLRSHARFEVTPALVLMAKSPCALLCALSMRSDPHLGDEALHKRQ